MKKYINFLFAAIVFFGTFTACSILENIGLDKATEAPVADYASDDKKIRFVGMTHIGQPEFYQHAQSIVKQAKADGYVLFYEFVDFEKDASDEELRKVRRMVGFVPTFEGYERENKSKMEEGYVSQNNELFLGHSNNKDFIVDITPTDLVGAYERIYEPIKLTQIDWDTPLDQSLPINLPVLQIAYIIKDYRNEYLAKEIEKSQYDKILVVYGAAHERGLFKELKSLDGSWKSVGE